MASTNVLRVGSVDLGDGYPPPSAFSVPVTDGLTGAFLLCGGLDMARRNWAGDNLCRVAGPITPYTGYVTFGDTAYLDTGILETAAMTFLAVYRKTDLTGGSGIIGSYLDSTNAGVGVYTAGSGTLTEARVQKVGIPAGNAMSITGTPTNWMMLSITVPATGAAKMRNETTGFQQVSSNTDAREVTGSDTIYVGGLPNGGFRRSVDMGCAATFNRALTVDELAAMVAWARSHMAAFGITV